MDTLSMHSAARHSLRSSLSASGRAEPATVGAAAAAVFNEQSRSPFRNGHGDQQLEHLHIADGELTAPPQAQGSLTPSLPPVDKGRGAITFLIMSFLLEASLWGYACSFGIVQLFLSSHAPFDKFSLASIGAVGTVALGLYLILPFPLVLLSRRFPHLVRPAVWIALVVNTAAMLASSYATSVAELIVLQGIVGGVSGAVLYIPALIYLQEWFVKRRGTASGIIFSGTGIGGAIFPYLISFLLERYGFGGATRIWTAISVVTLTPTIYFIRPRLPIVRPAPHSRFAPVDLSFLMTASALPMLLSSFFAGLAWYPVSVMVSTFTASLGPAFSSNIVLSLLNASNTIGGMVFGYYSDRIGYAWLWMLIGCGQGILALSSWGTASTLGAILAFVAGFGLLSAQASTWNACARDTAHEHDTDAATIFSALSVVRGVACIGGPLIAAALYEPDLSGDSSAWGRFGFRYIMIWVAAMAFGSGLAGVALAYLQPSSRKVHRA
ncbi:hypothetical protein HDU87_005695 [Geranomyces variabilis]|uniref:Major facilitator superfamily (MFS) profile domain-containing protein n=1 Tax=Geranomyces variabilis TaxID=109894 RepID=A0AAD5TH24_9FUNG|nr:hypothetical protein HDU87_005695 [Geranomyces variabilis]